jgi:hypothetical protein
MDVTVGRTRRKLQKSWEDDLRRNVTASAYTCVQAKKAADELEAQLLACAFGTRKCSSAEVERFETSLDEAVAVHEAQDAKLELAILQLEGPPENELAKSIDRCR